MNHGSDHCDADGVMEGTIEEKTEAQHADDLSQEDDPVRVFPDNLRFLQQVLERGRHRLFRADPVGEPVEVFQAGEMDAGRRNGDLA